MEQYDAMLVAQGGVCAICRKEPSDPRGFRPHIDHCHETGHVRGILYWQCNTGLGNFGDNIEALQRAIEYLREAKGEQ